MFVRKPTIAKLPEQIALLIIQLILYKLFILVLVNTKQNRIIFHVIKTLNQVIYQEINISAL